MNKFDNLTSTEIFNILIECDENYHNGTESKLNDSEYDTLRVHAENIEPHNVYFTGIGADIRGGKVKLPYQMGSLDQVQIGEIDDWINKWSLNEQGIVVTDKLDGISAMVIYDNNGDLQIAYSRGNGIEGADITRHIRKLKSIPKKVSGPMVLRGELIISYEQWESVKQMGVRSGGGYYKNARNAVAGVFNSKDNPEIIYSYINFVSYDILGFDGVDKAGMLGDLHANKFEVAHSTGFIGKQLTDDKLTDHINIRKSLSKYEIDGIVIDVNLSAKRNEMNPKKDTLNPAYAIKYKVTDASNIATATVVEVEWNISKHGYFKPRVKIEPTELVGVTIQHATGFNAKFIYENRIQPGCKVRITRSGDVIPLILGVVADGPLK